MNKTKFVFAILMIAYETTAFAGGILTNTNQNSAFDRMMARDAAIGIDGVLSNPAGVAFMSDGSHLSLNSQIVFQSRTIENNYPLFSNNINEQSANRKYKGHSFVPAMPSFQYAYNKNGYSFQAMFGVTGGGGKCTFDNGIGSFEKIVAETAAGVSQIGQLIDATNGSTFLSSDQMFGKTGSYSYNSFMRGKQYYYSLSLGVAKRLNDNIAVYVGARGIYAQCNYYGYVKDIKVGNVPLYTILDKTKTESADIELNCNQSGFGVTPIIGIDLKLGKWNLAAKYEFKTRIRLKNESVNQTPSIGGLASNLLEAGIPANVLQNENVASALSYMKTQFDTKLTEAIGEYTDGQKNKGDLPALATFGAQYTPIEKLRLAAGFHYFFDKQASQYNNREDKLHRGTMEWNAGAEYDLSKKLTVSAGWQYTNYGLSESYMEDKSFVTSSHSVGGGFKHQISKKIALGISYFHTFYSHFKTSEEVKTTAMTYSSDYTRSNNVFCIGLDIDF